MNPGNPPADLADLRTFLHGHLMDSVMPFWLSHGFDPAGGINTCVRDDGTLVSRDKWLWSQWRAVWVMSALYNRVAREPRWLDFAWHVCRFAARHGWDRSVAAWNLRVSGDGEVLDGPLSIYVDGFAIYGLAELIMAGGDGVGEAADIARATADSLLRRLDAPQSSLPTWPYPVPPGAKAHGLAMHFSLAFWELGKALDDDRYRQASARLSDDVFGAFYRPDRNLVLEVIGVDGREIPRPAGTAVVPGHVIEDMWFQIHIARERGDSARIADACGIILRHLQAGWDDVYGGLFLAVDADGADDVGWKFADTKLWWPHTEALYATLLAWEHTRDNAFLDWYRRLHEYSFSRYPVPVYGEWTQKLDRRGNPITEVVALPVKDPFHLPRALIFALDCLNRIA